MSDTSYSVITQVLLNRFAEQLIIVLSLISVPQGFEITSLCRQSEGLLFWGTLHQALSATHLETRSNILRTSDARLLCHAVGNIVQI